MNKSEVESEISNTAMEKKGLGVKRRKSVTVKRIEWRKNGEREIEVEQMSNSDVVKEISKRGMENKVLEVGGGNELE